MIPIALRFAAYLGAALLLESHLNKPSTGVSKDVNETKTPKDENSGSEKESGSEETNGSASADSEADE